MNLKPIKEDRIAGQIFQSADNQTQQAEKSNVFLQDWRILQLLAQGVVFSPN